jgi:hypothetical protein
MKSFIQAIAVAAVLAVPAVSFAQSNVADNGGAAQTATAPSYGGVADGTSATGAHHPFQSLDHKLHRVDQAIKSSIRPDPNDGMKPIYFGS